MTRPRVLLADDNAAVVRAVSRLLAPWCTIVGWVADGPALFDAVRELEPEVVLLDFSLAGEQSGLDICRGLKAMAPQVAIVAFTGLGDPDLPRAAQEAGAAAFVWKLRAPDELWPAIQTALGARR